VPGFFVFCFSHISLSLKNLFKSVKAIPLLLFFLILFTVHQTCLAQAPTEKPVEEQTPTEESPEEEAPKEKKQKKKSKKEKASEEQPPEESAVEDQAPAEEPPAEEEKKEKKEKKKKKGKKGEKSADETSSGDAPLEEAPAEEVVPTEAPAGYKDDKKKDTWFRVFKMQRCPIKSCETKMVHIHNGKKFRGRKKLKIIQSPKTGELNRVPTTDPGKRKKSKKVKKNREYQKEFKLPEKSS